VTPTTGLPADVERYLDAVRATLADLTAEERDDLLGDVEASLVEAADDDDGPLAARLGPPEEFAAELRASAGLAPPPATPASLPRPDPWGAALRRAWRSPVVVGLRRYGRELAPIWWLARGYLAVAVLAAFGWLDTWASEPALPRIGGPATTVLVLGLAVSVSVLLGLLVRRSRPAVRAAFLVLDVALLVAIVPVAANVLDENRASSRGDVIVYEQPATYVTAPSTPGVALDGVPVQNIYAYDREGRLLLDVRLFDENGRPLDVGADAFDPQRRLPSDAMGVPLFNAFPIRYFEPGTTVVADPTAGPAIAPTPLVTPPLDAAGTPSD